MAAMGLQVQQPLAVGSSASRFAASRPAASRRLMDASHLAVGPSASRRLVDQSAPVAAAAQEAPVAALSPASLEKAHRPRHYLACALLLRKARGLCPVVLPVLLPVVLLPPSRLAARRLAVGRFLDASRFAASRLALGRCHAASRRHRHHIAASCLLRSRLLRLSPDLVDCRRLAASRRHSLRRSERRS